MPNIAFRRLASDDLQQVFLWLIRPHVSRGYASAPSSFMETVAKFGPRTRDDNVVRAFIVNVDGRDAGYIQAYDVASFPDYADRVGSEPATWCLDLFIGEADFLHRGVGARVIDRFVREIVFPAGARACIAGPGEGNLAAVRAFEKAGFRRWKLLPTGEGEPELVLRRDRDPDDIRIAPIVLPRDAATCIAFRRDSFRESFGSMDGCDEEMGVDGARYLERLAARIAEVPEGNAHVWHGGAIIGQTEMRLTDEPRTGYVNLFYLVPAWRHRGVGRMLHDFAMEVFEARGMRTIRLSVAQRNAAAIAFYRRLGWKRVGARPHKQGVDVMELRL